MALDIYTWGLWLTMVLILTSGMMTISQGQLGTFAGSSDMGLGRQIDADFIGGKTAQQTLADINSTKDANAGGRLFSSVPVLGDVVEFLGMIMNSAVIITTFIFSMLFGWHILVMLIFTAIEMPLFGWMLVFLLGFIQSYTVIMFLLKIVSGARGGGG